MPALQEIPLAAVDLEDHPFTVDFATDLTPVLASLQAVGLLNPPWLRAKSHGCWQAVAGLKRLKAAAALGWETTPAQIVPADTPDSQCLLIALHDNAFGRSFSLGEQIFYAKRSCSFWDRETVTQRHLPLLGLPPSRKYLDRLLAAASLEEPWQTIIEQEKLALNAAARLGAWTPEDRLAVLPFFQILPFSQSKQEEFLERLELLSRREGVGITDLLARPELTSLLTDRARNPQEQAAAVRHRLKTWVFPRFSAAQASWETGLARLGLKQHPRLRLTPPPAFEGPDFHLEIAFRNQAELKELLIQLAILAEKKEFSVLTTL